MNDLWKFDGEGWLWMSGSNQINQNGVYGEKGIANSNNIPSGRYGALSWMDKSGNMWIFGGSGYAAIGNHEGNAIHVSHN
jgi:hypothetical protein